MTRPLHQSGMVIAQSCLARFNAEIIGDADTGGVPATLGTVVHHCVEMAYRATATGQISQIEAALSALRTHRVDNPDVPQIVYAEAETSLRRIYAPDSELYLRIPNKGGMQVEVEWALDEDFQPIMPGEGPPPGFEPRTPVFAGRMDEIRWGTDEGLLHRDWKHVLPYRSKADVKADTQLRVYSVALLSMFPDAPSVRSGWVMLRHGYEVFENFARDEPWYTQTKRWMSDMLALVRRAEKRDEWPEQVGAACGWCSVKHKCAAFSALIEQGSVPADASPEWKGRAHLALTKYAPQAKRAAEAAAKDGPIVVGEGLLLGHVPKVRKVMKPVAEILAQFDADDVTRDDIAAHFTGSSFTKKGLEELAVALLKRGVIECSPHEFVEMYRVEVPSSTFTTYPQPEEKTDDPT